MFEFLLVVCFKPYRAMFNNMTRGNKTFFRYLRGLFWFCLKPNRPCLIYRRSSLCNAAPIILRQTFSKISKCNCVLSYIHRILIFMSYTNPNDVRMFCKNLSTFFCYNCAYFLSLFLFFFWLLLFPISRLSFYFLFQNKQI